MSTSGTIVQVPAEGVSQVACEAGTGDIFTAAFLLRDGLEPRRRLTECNAVAARHLSGRGDFLPRLDS